MVLDLKSIFRGDKTLLPLDFSLDLSEEELGGSFPFTEPVQVTGKIENRADVVTLSVVCKVVVSKPCDRCGKDASSTHEIDISRVLVREIAGEDNDEFLLVEGEKLDLYELCRSEIILNLPMKHLCSEDCKGACPICGKNLNDGECGCETKWTDPRLEALSKLLEQND